MDLKNLKEYLKKKIFHKFQIHAMLPARRVNAEYSLTWKQLIFLLTLAEQILHFYPNTMTKESRKKLSHVALVARSMNVESFLIIKRLMLTLQLPLQIP